MRADGDVLDNGVALTPGERLLDPETRLQHALDLAYRYLSRRDRTVREVRTALLRSREGRGKSFYMV